MRAMDKGQWTVPSSIVRKPSSVAFLTLLLLLLSAGCRNRALDQAQQEAREAKTTLYKLNYSLKTAAEEIATVKAELSSVRQNRDELQKQVEQLTRERDQASMFAQRAQEAITRLTTQTDGQGSTTVVLQRQVSELKTLVEEQQKLIDQLQKGVTAQPAAPPAQAATEPNEKP
jgi:chromosome segregation ATPase